MEWIKSKRKWGKIEVILFLLYKTIRHQELLDLENRRKTICYTLKPVKQKNAVIAQVFYTRSI